MISPEPDDIACGMADEAPQQMQVYDADNDRVITVTTAEAAAGLVRYARTLGPGSPACGEYERRALKLRTGEEG